MAVKLDIKNCFNEEARAVMLRRMSERRRLAHLVPFLHAVLAHASELYVGDGRLFPEEDRRGSEEGLPQGFPLSSGALSVAIHPELCALDAELRPYGGCARALMDDTYALGPASAVFPALSRFAQRIKEAHNLELQPLKSSCYSPSYVLDTCPYRRAFGCPIGDHDSPQRPRGIIVGGVPIGDDAFVIAVLEDVVDQFDLQADRVEDILASSPHSQWAALYHSLASRFDYWLRHVPPTLTRPGAARVDQRLLELATNLGYPGMLLDRITVQRFRLPARMRGCGVRSRVMLAPVAFCSAMVEAAERMLDKQGGVGGDGFFNMLTPTFGVGAFSGGGHRLTQYLAALSPTAVLFSTEWDSLVLDGMGVEGPLAGEAAQFGNGRVPSGSLQNLATVQLEQVLRDELHADVMRLPRTDTRRVAWLSCDNFSSQWVSSWPRGQPGDGNSALNLDGFGGREFGEVFSTYLGRESPAVRTAVARVLRTRAMRRGRRRRHMRALWRSTDARWGSRSCVSSCVTGCGGLPLWG